MYISILAVCIFSNLPPHLCLEPPSPPFYWCCFPNGNCISIILQYLPNWLCLSTIEQCLPNKHLLSTTVQYSRCLRQCDAKKRLLWRHRKDNITLNNCKRSIRSNLFKFVLMSSRICTYWLIYNTKSCVCAVGSPLKLSFFGVVTECNEVHRLWGRSCMN